MDLDKRELFEDALNDLRDNIENLPLTEENLRLILTKIRDAFIFLNMHVK